MQLRTHQRSHPSTVQRGSGKGAYAPGYAAELIGSASLPGSSGPERTERSHTGIFNMLLETWLPFTAGIMSRFIPPRPPATPFDSPYDVATGEDITRFGTFPSSDRPFPYPYVVGCVSGFMPMLDQLSMQWAFGKTPSGPGVATPVPVPWDAQYPQLPKVTG